MPVMSPERRERFLAEVHVGVIGVARPGQPPLTVPVWYHYEPGGDVLVQTSPDSLKFRLLDEAGEFSLLVQTETPPYRYVSVSGPVVAVEPRTPVADLESLTYRYLDGQAAADHLEQIRDLTIATLHMRPRRWYSADFGA
jgi:Pyridoxamine 5'-phosphate oxidase